MLIATGQFIIDHFAANGENGKVVRDDPAVSLRAAAQLNDRANTLILINASRTHHL